MTQAPEFSQIIALASIGDRKSVVLEATPDQCAALAKRFGILALDRLGATLELAWSGPNLLVTGQLKAHAIQACGVSGKPVPEDIEDPIMLRLEPGLPDISPEDFDFESLADDLDDDFEVDSLPENAVDVGEIVAQSLALALNPFPRAADSELGEARTKLLSEEEAQALSNPFSVLKRKG
jgi:uncharacterized metal-binding protein YceD (DUF177 family)